ncbi:hypothetical protein RIVM261_046050 [Rivularia sp. IAM M-261]|nr:hypothetical protein CAL7716_087570 [Calothrix sp. PCC 7716]GJD19649.1 hypothetical protein RIVM261_046050 [Rivularia sp. IAM M-261]
MKLGVLTLALLLVSVVYKDTQLLSNANQTLISCTTSEPTPPKNSGGGKGNS